MIELGPVTEDDMVLAFLQAEIDSPRYGALYSSFLSKDRLDRRSIIDHPNLQSAEDNWIRKGLLRGVRGYSDAALFTGFPRRVSWRRVTIRPAEFGILKYIKDGASWMEVSSGTRLVTEGARYYAALAIAGPNAKIGKFVKEIREGERNITAIANDLKNGKRYPPLIAVEAEDKSLILVEGHSRATAYASARIDEPVEVIVGSSPQMKNWFYY
jgi:hypothetical protein